MKEYIEFLISTELNGNLNGSIVECGFGNGGSALCFLQVLEEMEIETDVWFFDSFIGFPEPTREDAKSIHHPRKGFRNLTGKVLMMLNNLFIPTVIIQGKE